MVSPSVRMIAEWSVPQGEMTPINNALQSLMVATRAVPGCIACGLSTQLGERAGFHYEEEWRTEDELIVQVRSDRFAKLAHLMESALEQPRIEFELPGGIRGKDYADEIRGRAGDLP